MTTMNQNGRLRANRPRSGREFVTDTLRELDLALDRAEQETSRLRRAAADARRAAARAERALQRNHRPTPAPAPKEEPASDGLISEPHLRSVS